MTMERNAGSKLQDILTILKDQLGFRRFSGLLYFWEGLTLVTYEKNKFYLEDIEFWPTPQQFLTDNLKALIITLHFRDGFSSVTTNVPIKRGITTLRIGVDNREHPSAFLIRFDLSTDVRVELHFNISKGVLPDWFKLINAKYGPLPEALPGEDRLKSAPFDTFSAK
jgi:hypothetical protein